MTNRNVGFTCRCDYNGEAKDEVCKYLRRRPEVNHIDGDKLNNSANNLEWVSTRQNQLHAVRMGKSHQIKINMATADKIRALYATGHYTQRELARIFGLGKTNIGYIINDKRWKNNIRQNERNTIQVGNKRRNDRR